MPDEVSASALARMLGITKRALSDAAQRDIVVRGSRDGAYALEPSVRGYCSHLRRLATGRGGEKATEAAAVGRGRLAAAQASIAEAKAAKMRGELVPIADIEREWTGICRAVRGRVLAVGQRHPAADADIRDALESLAGGAGNAAR